MVNLKKYNLQGEEIGEVAVSESMTQARVNLQLIKDLIVSLNNNKRQWSASTKTRAEVKHTTKKPHKQKGTGRARQGSTVSPQFRGGGIVFGPKPKENVRDRINKKQKRAALKHLISEMIDSGRVIILDSMKMDAPSTKTLAKFIDKVNLEKRILFLSSVSTQTIEVEGVERKVHVASNDHESFAKSVRNLEKVEFSLSQNISGLDIAKAKNIVMTEESLGQITEWLS